MHEQTNPLLSIVLVVHNGAHWLRPVLDAVQQQSYTPIEVIVRDNASTDATASIVRDYPSIRLILSSENVGPWIGFEQTLPQTEGTYVMLLTDVIMDSRCAAEAVAALQRDTSIGAIQVKVLQMEVSNDQVHKSNRIDTTGFQVSHSRRVTNRGQGEEDRGQYDNELELLAVEGAAPLFRRSALEQSRIDGWLVDPAYRVGSLGYGDDLDLAWRMRVFGFRQIYVPTAIAWHDRSTTKIIASTPIIGQLGNLSRRRLISLQKRRLDWSNVRFTIIKNDAIINILRDLPRIVLRELAVLGYTLLFEPSVIREVGRFIQLLPRMVRLHRLVMKRARTSASQIYTLLS